MGKRLPRYVRQHTCGSYRAVVSRRDGQGGRWYGPLRYTPEEAAADAVRFRGVVDPRGTPTIADGFAMLLRRLDQRKARQGTVDFYLKCYRYLTAPGRFPSDRDLLAVTPDQVYAYEERRRSDGVSLSTAWKEIGLLQRIISAAIKAQAIRLDPLEGLERPRIRSERFSHRTAEEVAKIREVIMRPRKHVSPAKQARDSALVGILFGSGIRRAELARLQVRHLDFGTGTMHIDGKSANRRIPLVGMCLDAALVLAKDRRPDQPLYGSVRLIEKAFERIQKLIAGDPELIGVEVSPHRLRHSFASDAVRRGVPLPVLSTLLGHASFNQTKVYYHEHDEQLRDAMRQIGGGGGAP